MRSPSGTSSPATGSTDFSTGVLSPVSAASSISSVAATIRRPSAGTLSPASKVTMSPGTTSSAGMSTRCAASADMRVDQEHLLERGDALRRLALLVEAEDRVQHGQADDHETGRPLLQRDDADDRGAEQDELHQVAVLAEERAASPAPSSPPRACSGRPPPVAARPRRRRDRTAARPRAARRPRPPSARASSRRDRPAGRLLDRGSAHRVLGPDDDDLVPCEPTSSPRWCSGPRAYDDQPDHAQRRSDRKRPRRASPITTSSCSQRHPVPHASAARPEHDDAERGQRREQRPDPAEVAVVRARARSRGRPSRPPRSG